MRRGPETKQRRRRRLKMAEQQEKPGAAESEPAQTEPALANLNFEGLEGFNVRKSGPIEVAFKSKETKGTVID